MKSFNSGKEFGRRQHVDFKKRPDGALIWLDELVINPRHPENQPMVKITRPALRRTIAEGLFPEPAICRNGREAWRLDSVRDWVRARDALNPATASPYDDVLADSVRAHTELAQVVSGPMALVHARPTWTKSDRNGEPTVVWKQSEVPPHAPIRTEALIEAMPAEGHQEGQQQHFNPRATLSTYKRRPARTAASLPVGLT